MAEEQLFKIRIDAGNSLEKLNEGLKEAKKNFAEATTAKDRLAQVKEIAEFKKEIDRLNQNVKNFVTETQKTQTFPKTIQGMRDNLKQLNQEWKNAKIG